MALSKTIMLQMLEASFPGAEIILNDFASDEDHYELEIKHSSFVGLSKLQQHKMVYKALGDYVGNQLHALSIKTSF